MQTNLSVNNTNPAFGAKVSKDLVNAAHNYYKSLENGDKQIKHFYKQSKHYYRYGFDKAEINFERRTVNGKDMFILFAQDGNRKVILSQKDQFRNLLEKFMHMSGFEFGVKMTKK